MAYLVVEDFRFGMDRRRERVAGTPGTLWLGKNIHLTRGGDIERRKKFVPEYTVTGSFGAATLRGQHYVFGSADLAAGMPIGVNYQRLQAPSTPAMTKVLDVKSFAGKLYVVAEYADGNIYHFYDATRVSDWDNIADDGASFDAVAEALAEKIETASGVTASAFGSKITIQAVTPGTAFTISRSTTDGGSNNDQDITLTAVQANVAAVTEVVSTATITIAGGTAVPGTNQIRSLLINSVEILEDDLDWSGSNASTAIRLASAITAGYTTHGYSAAASDNVVTISAAPGTGTTPNGYEVIATTYGDVSVTADAAMAGGVAAVTAAAQVHTAALSGTFQVADTFSITVNGTAYVVTGRASGMGRNVFVHKQRLWSPVRSVWRYCMLLRADIWDPANVTADNDAGFINVASETEGNENLVVAARYEQQAAVFSDSSIALFSLDVDPANNALSDTLDQTGTSAPQSATRYGNNDVFYLDRTGIRSLRARDGTNAPFVSDVGNNIDPFVQEYADTLTKEQYTSAIGAIEPRDGRLWMALGDRIFVFSHFPSAKISAWSYYELDEFDGEPMQAITRIRSTAFVRAGNYIYAYGGLDGADYPDEDEAIAEVQLPFLSGKTPATIKQLAGFDLAGTNTWECSIAFDPNYPDRTINVGGLSKITFSDENKIAMPGRTSMVAANLTCRKAGAATLSMVAIHYDSEEAG